VRLLSRVQRRHSELEQLALGAREVAALQEPIDPLAGQFPVYQSIQNRELNSRSS
jgi:hypothetical protein